MNYPVIPALTKPTKKLHGQICDTHHKTCLISYVTMVDSSWLCDKLDKESCICLKTARQSNSTRSFIKKCERLKS